jgi:hypothetical protein
MNPADSRTSHQLPSHDSRPVQLAQAPGPFGIKIWIFRTVGAGSMTGCRPDWSSPSGWPALACLLPEAAPSCVVVHQLQVLRGGGGERGLGHRLVSALGVNQFRRFLGDERARVFQP